MNGSRIRRVGVAAAMLFALLTLAPPAGAKPGAKEPKKEPTNAAGALDSAFGDGGKLAVAFPAENAGDLGVKYELPFEFTPGHLEMAAAPGGKVVVAGATRVVRFLSNGKLDSNFGNGGTAIVPSPPGARFVLASAAVDSVGRVVLAGLSRPVPTSSTPDPLSSEATVMRLDSSGNLDSSFGSGGMVVSDLGLGAPKAGAVSYPGGASVGLRDLVIDADNRPVLTGGYVSELSNCYSWVNSQGFVARLTEGGALDPSFGEGGLRPLATIATFGQLAAANGEYLALGAGGPQCTTATGPGDVLTGFSPDGVLDSNFGSFGFRVLSFRDAPALAIAPSGKILLLGRPEQRHKYKTVTKTVKGKQVKQRVQIDYRAQTVQRLLPGGALDPSFFRNGSGSYVDPKFGLFSALSADKEERVYLAGQIGKAIKKSPRHTLKRTVFLLARVLPKGSVDRSFGDHGDVTTAFGGPSSSFATQVMLVGKGRILVGGGITSSELSTGGGFAIARYLAGP